MTALTVTSRRAASRRGMTLMEVMLAISLVVLLMGGVYAFYGQAMETRDRITTAAERISAVRSVMDRMTREFRSAMVFTVPNVDAPEDEAPPADDVPAGAADVPAGAADLLAGAADLPEGVDASDIAALAEAAKAFSHVETVGMYGVFEPSQSVEFPTVGLPGPSAWAENDVTDSKSVVRAAGDVELIGYRLRVGDDGSVVGLERSRRNKLILTEKVQDVEEDTEWVLVSPHIKFLRIRYWKGDEWAEGWDVDRDKPSIPAAVEVTLGFVPLPEGDDPEDYEHQMFRRVIAIPTVGGGGASDLIRGLGEGGLR